MPPEGTVAPVNRPHPKCLAPVICRFSGVTRSATIGAEAPPDNVAMTTARIVILFALAAVDGVGYLERRIQSLEG